jgi:CheY-like chemotaxis protein
MQKQGHILVVDDKEQWRLALTGTLRGAGYDVQAASSIAEARELINSDLYHLLVLDIRMKEADPANIDGIDFLRELNGRGLGEAIEVVMLSGYGTLKQAREAFSEYKVADFIPKDEFFPEAFISIVNKIFANKVRTNVDLNIHWQRVGGPEEAVVNLLISGERIKSGDALQRHIAAELDELLRRLFHKAVELIVQPLSSGKSGTGVLWVQPFYSSGGAPAKVVKFGDYHEIHIEYENFKSYVSPYVGGGRSAAIDDLRRTARLGGIIYSHLGTASERLESFGSYYSRSDISEIKSTLDRLFHGTCGPWYANAGVLHPYDLTEHYRRRLGFTADNLERALTDNLKSVVTKMIHGRKVLHFNTLGGTRDFADPFLALDRHYFRSTYECITHGDLHSDNILVDANGQTWLIDFQGTGPGHILRDVAELDSVVRFQLLAAGEATLDERLELEEKLCALEGFEQIERASEGCATGNPHLDKACATILHLRAVARQLIAQNRESDISEYNIALFYYALNSIRFYSLSGLQRQHALLCASLLANILKS